MLSKKHFKRIAEIIRETKQESSSDESLRILGILENRLMNYFQNDNPRFSRTRFTEATQVKTA